MADTLRDLTTLVALFADNSANDISEQDFRDLLVSLQGSHGSISVQGNATATTIANTTSYVEVEPATGLGTALRFDQSANGRLRYNDTPVLPNVDVLVTVTATIQTDSANQDIFLRIGKSGVTDALSEQRVKKLVAGDNVTVTLQLLTSLVDAQYFSLFVRNTTSISDVTVVNLNITAITRMT